MSPPQAVVRRMMPGLVRIIAPRKADHTSKVSRQTLSILDGRGITPQPEANNDKEAHHDRAIE